MNAANKLKSLNAQETKYNINIICFKQNNKTRKRNKMTNRDPKTGRFTTVKRAVAKKTAKKTTKKAAKKPAVKKTAKTK